MKTIITSNWRPLCRALCTVLIGTAGLWAMPRNARAQLYVSQIILGSVGEYNLTTGAFNPNAALHSQIASCRPHLISGYRLVFANNFRTYIHIPEAVQIRPAQRGALMGPRILRASARRAESPN